MSTPPALDALRTAVRQAAAASSLRAVAEDVGLTHRGLSLFLDGSTPRESTLRKLQTWYLRTAAARGDLTREGWTVALAFFLESVPEEQRAEARAELVAALRKVYTKRGIELPGWINAAD
jgi:hypothetical protein